MKKKLLFITHSAESIGGAEEEFERLLKYFSSKNDKYEIHALFPDGQRKMQYARYCSKWGLLNRSFLPVINDNIVNYARYILAFFKQRRQIFNFINNTVYDLCIINVVVLLWPIFFMRFKKIKTIVFIREEIYPNLLRHVIYKLISRCVNYFIPVSKVNKNDFIRTTKNENISTIYPALETDFASSDVILEKLIVKKIYKALTLRNTFKFLNVAAVYLRKNQMLILKSFLKLKKSNVTPLPFVFFIGEFDPNDYYYKELQSFIITNELNDYCFFLGGHSRNVVYEVFKYVDASIISSVSEGLPMTIVESFKFFKPVISTKVGGIPEIVTNMKNGILIDFNENDLTAAMIKLMTDNELCKKLAEQAYTTYLEKFNLDYSMKKTEEIFDKVMLGD